jgi:eukaryotic translation initiation factor 2C
MLQTVLVSYKRPIASFGVISEPKFRQKTLAEFEQLAKPTKLPNGAIARSEVFLILQLLGRLQFTVTHRGKTDNPRAYSIQGFEFNAKYGLEGGTTKTIFVEDYKDKQKLSLVDFYFKTYKYRAQLSNWPVVTTVKAGMFPIDACMVERM